MRKAALLVLNSVAHNKPAACGSCRSLSMLFAETRRRRSSFTKWIWGRSNTPSDGLSCARLPLNAWTPPDHCADRLELPAFIACLADGLRDDHDIKVS